MLPGVGICAAFRSGRGLLDVRRTAVRIRRSDAGFIKLSMHSLGQVTWSRETTALCSSLATLPCTNPAGLYSLHFASEFRMLVLMFPRPFLHCPGRFLDAIASRRIRRDCRAGAIVSPLLRMLDEQLRNQSLPARAEVADAVLSFVSASAGEELREEALDVASPS